jgi:predicted type IV restriction endonuclease
MPFLAALGYYVFDPKQVLPEFVADVGIKKGEKVDFAIYIDNILQFIIEVKSVSTKLQTAQYSQLHRYFSVVDAKISILTNGREYWFFTDIDASNRMDEKPFFKFDLLSYDDSDIKELDKFSKDAFSIDKVIQDAANLKYMRLANQYLNEQFANPDDEFVRYVGRKFYDGNITTNVLEQLRPIVKRAIDDVVRQRVRTRLEVALDDQPTKADEAESSVNIGEVSDIITTDDEKEAFSIVRAIASSDMDASRVYLRDQKSYCSIIVEDNNRKPVCRLYFDGKQKYILIYNKEKGFDRFDISQIYDIYRWKENITQALLMHAK